MRIECHAYNKALNLSFYDFSPIENKQNAYNSYVFGNPYTLLYFKADVSIIKHNTVNA